MRFLFRTPEMAISAIRRHIMRSALTTLGIVIGVAAVIAMVEIGEGAAREVEAAIASMGSNTILVLPGNLAMAGVAGGAGSAMNLSPADALAMADHCSALCNVAPLVAARTQGRPDIGGPKKPVCRALHVQYVFRMRADAAHQTEYSLNE